jgi:hypothetical protein
MGCCGNSSGPYRSTARQSTHHNTVRDSADTQHSTAQPLRLTARQAMLRRASGRHESLGPSQTVHTTIQASCYFAWRHQLGAASARPCKWSTSQHCYCFLPGPALNDRARPLSAASTVTCTVHLPSTHLYLAKRTRAATSWGVSTSSGNSASSASACSSSSSSQQPGHKQQGTANHSDAVSRDMRLRTQARCKEQQTELT